MSLDICEGKITECGKSHYIDIKKQHLFLEDDLIK